MKTITEMSPTAHKTSVSKWIKAVPGTSYSCMQSSGLVHPSLQSQHLNRHPRAAFWHQVLGS